VTSVNHRPVSEIERQWVRFERPDDGALFRHYKGGLYEIVATGFIETTEEPAVVYRSRDDGTTWVRTAANFFEEVRLNDEVVPRFNQYDKEY